MQSRSYLQVSNIIDNNIISTDINLSRSQCLTTIDFTLQDCKAFETFTIFGKYLHQIPCTGVYNGTGKIKTSLVNFSNSITWIYKITLSVNKQIQTHLMSCILLNKFISCLDHIACWFKDLFTSGIQVLCLWPMLLPVGLQNRTRITATRQKR